MKKSLKPVELFLALGLAATVTACGGPAADTPEDAPVGEDAPANVSPSEDIDEAEDGAEDDETDESDEGGEGGEGGEG